MILPLSGICRRRLEYLFIQLIPLQEKILGIAFQVTWLRRLIEGGERRFPAQDIHM